MKRVDKLMCLVILCALSVVATGFGQETVRKNPVSSHRGRYSLDGDSTAALTIRVTDSVLELNWFPSPVIFEWAVLSLPYPSGSPAETLIVTSDTFYVVGDMASLPDPRFYSIVPLPPGPAESPVVIEDFENGVTLGSIPGEDFEPNNWAIISTDSYNGSGHSLRLYGNTWKSETIPPTPIEFGTVWRVAMKTVRDGEMQSFGVGDSANWMRYIIWGSQCPQAQVWITTYQGWFDEDEWIPVYLPIGEDWHGRFGYLPNITELHFVDDNDNTSPRGEVLFDEILDVTDWLPVPPLADFRCNIISGAQPDSVRVSFLSLARDADSDVIHHRWDFGDGFISSITHPTHDYPEHGLYTVTLTVTDDDENVAWRSYAVVDSPVTMNRELRMSFCGDVMLGRGYEQSGGIIQTQGVEAIFEPTQHLFEPFDLASCNLESPLTTATTGHPTKGILLKGSPANVAGLVFAGFDFATLANNHILDYMEAGMLQTMQVCDGAGIAHGGADMNDLLARRTKFLSRNGLSLAMLSFSDRTGSYNNYQPFLDAGRSRPGFAMWNRSAIEATIPEAAALADFVVLNVHSGSEYKTQPQLSALLGLPEWDPEIILFDVVPDTTERRLRQYAIDNGADLVVTHHPHIFQGFEVYQGKLIAHSLGNFAFDLSYAECLPTVVLQVHISAAGGVDEAILHPIYIDDWIPQPATGEFGGAILDYLSEMSRRLDTWMVRAPGEDTARIIWDTTAVTLTGQEWTDTLALFDQDGWWTSLPHRLDGGGYPVSAEVLGLPSAQIRVGRDLLWFGNMEDQGATPWNLNSGDEAYNQDYAHGGSRSIRLRRVYDAGDNVVTTLSLRSPLDDALPHSLVGWIRTENAGDATIEMQFWTQRSGGTLISQPVAGYPLSGENDWTYVASDLNVPGATNFYNIRLSLYPPTSGTGYAWFDDLALVQWDSWQPVSTDVPFPSDFTYLQVRSSSSADSAAVHYRREWIP
ncbi:CapA family protein [bacterium]|nr:CapA family protein [bacterium]MBU1984763.1 CapA family protein [bacterium]